MKTMTDKVATESSGTWNRTYRVTTSNSVGVSVSWLSRSIATMNAVKAGERARDDLKSVGKSLSDQLSDRFDGLIGSVYVNRKAIIRVGGTREVAIGCSGNFEWDVDEMIEREYEKGHTFNAELEDDILEHVMDFLTKKGFDER